MKWKNRMSGNSKVAIVANFLREIPKCNDGNFGHWN